MLSRKKRYKPQLKKAAALLHQSTRLIAPYLYDPHYQPTETEIALLAQLVEAYQSAQAYTQNIANTWQQEEKG